MLKAVAPGSRLRHPCMDNPPRTKRKTSLAAYNAQENPSDTVLLAIVNDQEVRQQHGRRKGGDRYKVEHGLRRKTTVGRNEKHHPMRPRRI